MNPIAAGIDQRPELAHQRGRLFKRAVAFKNTVLNPQPGVFQRVHHPVTAGTGFDIIGDHEMHPPLPEHYSIEDTQGRGWPGWLEQLWWRDVWLTFEATAPGALPPFLGSSIRGALGGLFRNVLCASGECVNDCAQPDNCRYHALFEQAAGGTKPYVVLSPLPPGLEEIVLGSQVSPPWNVRFGPHAVPVLSCQVDSMIARGSKLRFGLRFVGALSNALPAVVSALALMPFSMAGCSFKLQTAEDGFGLRVFDARAPHSPPQMPHRCFLWPEAESARRIRVLFQTPTLLKVGADTTFEPVEIASRFVDNCVATVRRMQRTCTGREAPFVDVPKLSLAAHRLFGYDLPRQSVRQGRWLHFDGIVGSIDLAGDASSAMPWIRAAEIFHFGQKAAFGMGAIRVLNLE